MPINVFCLQRIMNIIFNPDGNLMLVYTKNYSKNKCKEKPINN